MRTTKVRSKLSLLFIALAALIAIPAAVALADNVQNNIVAGGNDTITTSGTSTVNYEVKNTSAGGSGFAGCDASDGSTLTLTINKPAAVTVSPGSLTFNSCDSPKPVQFSSSTVGDYSITVTASDTHGNYNVNPAAFTLHVTAPPPPTNTAPTLSLPSNPTAEATGPGGAAVSYNATATDKEDGPLTPTCTPASGSTFGLGSTQVNCSATDSGGLSASGFFTVTVVDTTAPTLNLPADITEEATGASGAAVSYSASATDLVDGPLSANCSPASGSTFGLGSTQVNCSATDDAGNTANGSFTVTVEDTTPPALNLPANITEEATGASGAAVSYSASATDLVDGPLSANCSPASGSTFGLGSTQVNCSATDDAGNTANGSFTVTVEDTTPPNNITFNGGISDGAEFYYGDVPAQPTCSASDVVGLKDCVVTGYSTNVGTHTLTATATDNAGNSATKTLSYTVKAWTFNGFFQPVDMNNVINTVKGGSTVPIKFELFKGTTELTATSNVKQPLTAKQINCGSLASTGTDEIELTATGGTSLRYDTTGGQFIYNWQTPKGPVGSCYAVTISAQDGSSKTAYFKLK